MWYGRTVLRQPRTVLEGLPQDHWYWTMILRCIITSSNATALRYLHYHTLLPTTNTHQLLQHNDDRYDHDDPTTARARTEGSWPQGGKLGESFGPAGGWIPLLPLTGAWAIGSGNTSAYGIPPT